MFAQVTKNGTAMSETALCDTHNTAAMRREFRLSADDETGDQVSPVFVRCDGNDALFCGVCGHEGPG